MNSVDHLAELFGGRSRLADACGVSRSVVSKWANDRGGRVPSRYNVAVLTGCRVLGIAEERARLHLELACPCCGRAYEEN